MRHALQPDPLMTASDLLARYDAQLRAEAEMQGALEVTRRGPLWIGRYEGGVLFVSYRDLDDPAARVAEVAAMLADETSIVEAEWKTRSHDQAPGLEAALSAAGFAAGEPESVMVGRAEQLTSAASPAGVTIREVTAEGDVRAALEMQDAVFGGVPRAERMLAEILSRRERGEPVELWAAEVDGRIVSAGRIEIVVGTEFAGVWGGATLPEYRGRGVYRALTAARVRSAMRRGARWIHSDSTEFSRPILERAGLKKVTETVPWTWEREPAPGQSKTPAM